MPTKRSIKRDSGANGGARYVRLDEHDVYRVGQGRVMLDSVVAAWQQGHSPEAIRSQYTPADEAARRVVDAICDDDGPLRYGCDDLSEGMLAGWNTTDNARWVRGMLRGFVE